MSNMKYKFIFCYLQLCAAIKVLGLGYPNTHASYSKLETLKKTLQSLFSSICFIANKKVTATF